jgi:hypothetical protein
LKKCLRLSLLPSLLLASFALEAQQPIGTVGVQDVTVAGALEVTNGRAILIGSTTVTAKDHMAEIALNRGGSVNVCATSGLHVTSGKSDSGPAPLMLALDRGAIEVQTTATTSDVVMTPDLRFTLPASGPLDLRLRVIQNGDTCVDNRGDKAPVINVAEQFGDAVYQLHPGQHVLFEHGSLKEVVDHESSECGCPPVTVISVADSGVTSATPAAPGTPAATEQQHPFPAAVSAGLAPTASVPQAPPGVVHAQVSTSLHYEGDEKPAPASAPASTADSTAPAPTARPASGPESAPQPAPAVAAETRTPSTAQAPPPPPQPPTNDLVHVIGRFFKRLFGSH